jgi:DNA-binding response OmpR family regulator
MALQASSYDLLITDNQMPGISGAELILRLRRRDTALPIIVVSSDLGFFTESRCQLLRIAAVVPKPFGFGQLSHAVGRVLCAGHNVGWDPGRPQGFLWSQPSACQGWQHRKYRPSEHGTQALSAYGKH